jgi:GNAT superfamily N-acetyltransferase
LAGVATYLIEDDEFEVVALAATGEVRGTGHALMMDLLDMARQAGVRRMRLVTTNDNLRAIGFYQIIGMTIARVGINAVEQARKLKPDIPRTGENGIPIRDEIEFEYLIKD